MSRYVGRLKVYDAVKGYGFISMDKGKDVFVNYKEFETSSDAAVVAGLILEFNVIDGGKGPRATDVKVIG